MEETMGQNPGVVYDLIAIHNNQNRREPSEQV
jgi:hypothetical protein